MIPPPHFPPLGEKYLNNKLVLLKMLSCNFTFEIF